MTEISIVICVCIVTLLQINKPLADGEYCEANTISGEGDLYFAAILELHGAVSGTCSTISPTELQVAVAIDWVVQKLNGNGAANQSFIPGVKIGYKIYDDCGLRSLATKHLFDIWDVGSACNGTRTSPPLAGIIGTGVSHTTTTVANLLKSTQIPMFGLSATLPELSNKTLYPNFIRTVPSDVMQSKAIVEIIKQLKWTYIIGVHTDDNYGTEGFREFRRLAEESGICIFLVHVIRRSNSKLGDSLENFIRELFIHLQNTRNASIGGVFFGHAAEAALLYRTVTERKAKWPLDIDKIHHIHWVMSDGVGTSSEVVEELRPYSSLVLSVSPAFYYPSDFEEHFLNLLKSANETSVQEKWAPWINEYFIKVYHCTVGINCPLNEEALKEKFTPYDYITSAFDALYSLMTTFKLAHRNLCNQENSLCQRLKEKMHVGLLPTSPPEVKYQDIGNEFVPEGFFKNKRVLSTDQTGDLVAIRQPLYFINIAVRGQWLKVGQFESDKLNIDVSAISSNRPSSVIPGSDCKKRCPKCFKNAEIPVVYAAGDELILGIFSLHETGNSGAYSCGHFRSETSSFVVSLSFLNAIKALKKKTGLNFGGIVIDDCYNPLRLSLVLNDLFSGTRVLRDPDTATVIDVSKIVAVVGAQSSTVTLAALQTLSRLGIPLVSYAATSPDLDDRVTFPYFLRTVPSDTIQAKAMLEIVKMLGVTHVATININNNYGRRGVQHFKILAEAERICVDDSGEIGVNDSKVKYISVVNAIENKRAKVVVFFGLHTIISKIFDVMVAREPLVFIGSEAWGTNPNVLLRDRGTRARGSLVLTVDTSVKTDDQFSQYLTDVSLQNQSSNPWIREFWQTTFECNLPGGYDNPYDNVCSESLHLEPQMIRQFVNDQSVVNTANAVLSIGHGLIKAREVKCRVNTRCTSVTPADLLSAIREVSLTSSNGQAFKPFQDDGNGNIGFQIHNIQRASDNSYKYVTVGKYTQQRGLQIQKDQLRFYNIIGDVVKTVTSSCKYLSHCRVCKDSVQVGVNNATTPTHLTSGDNSSGADSLVPVVAVLAVLCCILIVFLGIIVCLLLRRNVSFLKGSLGSQIENMRDDVRDGQVESHQYHTIGLQGNAGEVTPTIPYPCIPQKDNLSSVNSSDHSNVSSSGTPQTLSSSRGTPSVASSLSGRHMNPIFTLSGVPEIHERQMDMTAENKNPDYLNPLHSASDYIHPVFEDIRFNPVAYDTQKSLFSNVTCNHERPRTDIQVPKIPLMRQRSNSACLETIGTPAFTHGTMYLQRTPQFLDVSKETGMTRRRSQPALLSLRNDADPVYIFGEQLVPIPPACSYPEAKIDEQTLV